MLNPRKFKKYRPKKPSNRLEGEYFNNFKVWAPSIHYNFSLTDVKTQMTPSEFYRDTLKYSGKHIRMIQRLEWRWNKQLKEFTHGAQTCQRLWWGWKGRRYFNKVKTELALRKAQRETYASAMITFDEGKYDETLAVIDKIGTLNFLLQCMKTKIYYIKGDYNRCIHEARLLIEIEPSNDDGYFLLGSCLVKKGKFEQASQELKIAMTVVDTPGPNLMTLNGAVALKLRQLEDAWYSFDQIVRNNPADMNSLLNRGCAAFTLQEWQKAIDDFSLILYYQPFLPNVLCLRARVFACVRKWDLAKKDYEDVLLYYPDYADAIQGLDDIDNKYEELPMMDHARVEDATNY